MSRDAAGGGPWRGVDSTAFSAMFDARCADIKAIDLALDVGHGQGLVRK